MIDSEMYVIPMKEIQIIVIFYQNVLTKTSYFSFGQKSNLC